MRYWTIRIGVGLVVMLAGGASAAVAQSGTVSGVVLDADAGAPVAGASVALVPGSGAVIPARSDDGTAFARSNLATRTDRAGAYRFTDVAAGRYTLRVECIGYRSATVRIELRGAADSRISVELTVDPVRLDPVSVGGEARALLNARSGAAALELGRVPAIRLRQRRYLSTDVRVLANDDLVEAVTLGERDIFRALHRLPGVTGWDDVSAELWTRGAGRGETLTLFDGVPLYEPLHGNGDLTAVSPDGIGMAFFHPGVRPADQPGAGAAVVDLRTRPGNGDEEGGLRGLADVSLSSARLSLDGRSEDGSRSWLLAGRRSYVDLLTENPAYQMVAANRFWDVTGRVDLELGGGARLEASGLWQSNGYDGADSAYARHWSGGHRGTLVGRATLRLPLGTLRAAQTVGFSRYGTDVGALEYPDYFVGGVEVPATDASLTHVVVRGRIEPADGGADGGDGGVWRAGYDVVHEAARYDGPEPRPRHLYNTDSPPRYVRDADGTRASLWAQRRWRVWDRLTVEAGARLDAGEADGGGAPGVRLAPSLMARLALTEHTALFAGVGRSYQYAQALAPTGISGVSFPRSTWLLADDDVPALRSDIVTAGAETWLGGSWLASVNGWARRTTGLTLPDPTPGDADAAELFVVGERRGYGFEASLRRVAGRATLSLAYSYEHARTEAAGLQFPSATDRPHALDATGLLRLGRGFRLGAALGWVSGIPYTRAVRIGGDDGEPLRWVLGEPHTFRTDPYRRLDLLVDWTHGFDGWGLGVYFQFRNALLESNATHYIGTLDPCLAGPPVHGAGARDCFLGSAAGGNLGIRVTF